MIASRVPTGWRCSAAFQAHLWKLWQRSVARERVWWLVLVSLTSGWFNAGGSLFADQETFRLSTIRGRVVWLSDALMRRHAVQIVPEAAERVLVLETAAGELHPLVEDVRGRAFRSDERLRRLEVELWVRQYPGSPFVQIVRAFEVRDGNKLELDYWCEICSIALYELKECDCCQGPIELRRRPVPDELMP